MTKYIRNSNYIVRTILDKTYLFPIGEEKQKLQGAILLDEVALFIWEILESMNSFSEIVNKVCIEFNANNADVTEDIVLFCKEMQDLGLIRKFEI